MDNEEEVGDRVEAQLIKLCEIAGGQSVQAGRTHLYSTHNKLYLTLTLAKRLSL